MGKESFILRIKYFTRVNFMMDIQTVKEKCNFITKIIHMKELLKKVKQKELEDSEMMKKNINSKENGLDQCRKKVLLNLMRIQHKFNCNKPQIILLQFIIAMEKCIQAKLIRKVFCLKAQEQFSIKMEKEHTLDSGKMD